MTWYDRNKDRVKSKQSEDYKNDKSKILQRNKKYRDKLEAGEIVRTKVVDGLILYSLSTVAARIQVDPRTIKAWESQQKIPKAHLVDRTRWYTLQDFILIQEIANAAKEDTSNT